ncbi:MAG: hypothetical protein M3O74_30255 [Pseudomonadota bacterium]|jgi:hypothetical protein|uniref:hypothetical protein n=1 Tax=Burkholderia sp. PAMC 26561 TaxID=1795043 RepID=UPI00078407E4|nr:hypothetical protein [Burkholderia sp. PAMC 26561]MDP9158514.1 hypothetical protein [Pseudomonadota bacterium]
MWKKGFHISHPLRTKTFVGFLAFAIAIILHIFVLLALVHEERRPRASRPQLAPLLARLIPDEISMPVSLPGRTHKATVNRAVPRKQSRNGSTDRRVPEGRAPPNVASAADLERRDPDWQADLGSITSHRSVRYSDEPRMPEPAAGTNVQRESPAETLEREMSKAVRNDCRDAYSRAGLLAIPMLAIDAMNRSGCKW